jgi:hypothetical protein
VSLDPGNSRRALAYVKGAVSGPPLDPDLNVTVHFHPDRLVAGVPLLRHLLSDGVYRSQFETGTSNGGLTAYPGGDRWQWEHRMFAGAYDEAAPAQRPTYGSLNYRRHPAGGSVRFGSAHLRLAGHVLPRTTFCYPDSAFEPKLFGDTALVRNWGRIGARGQNKIELFEDAAEARDAMTRLAIRKARRGYQIAKSRA